MRAFVVTGPQTGSVEDVPPPVPQSGQAVVEVARAGICGTDVGLMRVDFTRFRRGVSAYPMRLGHEWCGTVSSVGPGVDPGWVGRRVTGETMLGCGRCEHCAEGFPNLCPDRFEIGVRGNWPGAFAEQLPVPVSALHRLPDTVTDDMGAMIEPGANSYRAFAKAGTKPGDRVLVQGPGTIGLLAAGFALAHGCEVHVLGIEPPSLELARKFGVHGAWTAADLPDLQWNAVIDATGSEEMPAFALEHVRPGGTVVLIGGAKPNSTLDPRLVLRYEITVTGVMGGSQGFPDTVTGYAERRVDPTPLIAGTVGLNDIGAVLSGHRDGSWGARPKVLVDPRKG